MQRVKTADQITSAVQGVNWGFSVNDPDPEYDSYKNVDEMDEEELAKVAKRLGVSPDLLTEINSFFRDLKEATHGELAEIWQRITD